MLLQIETIVVGQLQTNCYLVIDKKSSDCLIIDPGADAENIQNRITDLKVNPKMIIATHGHFDHVLAVVDLQISFSIPFLINEKDIFLLKRMPETAEHFLKMKINTPVPIPDKKITESQSISVGSLQFEILFSPGHTPGGISLYFKSEKLLFSGDTWFADGGIGRTDFSYSSLGDLHTSLKQLAALPDETGLFSGHGRGSNIGRERRNISFALDN